MDLANKLVALIEPILEKHEQANDMAGEIDLLLAVDVAMLCMKAIQDKKQLPHLPN